MAKAWTFETKTAVIAPESKAKGFKHMAVAELKICTTSDR